MGRNKKTRKKGMSGKYTKMGRGIDSTHICFLCIVHDSEPTNTG